MRYQATIIVVAAVTKPEALSAISQVVGRPVQGSAAHPFVALPDGGRVTVEVPKCGPDERSPFPPRPGPSAS